MPILAALVLIVAVVVVVIVVSSGGGSSAPPGTPFAAAAQPVPTNRVTGTGTATVRLNGNVVSVSARYERTAQRRAARDAHPRGRPGRRARRRRRRTLHNGHLSISTTDGIKFYGPPQVSLTSQGDTSPKSIIDFSRYPTTGTIRYTRQFPVPPGVAAAIRAGNAVIVVHGIDYNGNGIYDNVLDRSELNRGLPGEATAPALCGTLVATKNAQVPGSGGSAATTYAVALHRFVAQTATGESAFLLLCHALGINPATLAGPTDARRHHDLIRRLAASREARSPTARRRSWPSSTDGACRRSGSSRARSAGSRTWSPT